jgi:iron(III) transport system substrate-binding protein
MILGAVRIVVNRAALGHHLPMRPQVLAFLLLPALLTGPFASAEAIRFGAKQDERGELRIYSSLDARLAEPLIDAFQSGHPDVTVIYEDLLSGDISSRILSETDNGQPTADIAFSSAMDLQMKLANDGYAAAVSVPETRAWPEWANWRNAAFAITFEPGVFVYHKPSFPDGPPDTRISLMRWLDSRVPGAAGRIGTYDIERSAVGYLYLARDQEHFPDVWSLVARMADAGLETFSTSQEIIERVADGRLLLGYNILGSYAADQARLNPDLGLLLPRDFTVVISRVALVPRAAARPDLGAQFLSFLMSREGQTILAEKLRLPAVSLEVSDEGSARAMLAALGAQLRPVAVNPGLLVYLDQAKRRGFIARWRQALEGQAGN